MLVCPFTGMEGLTRFWGEHTEEMGAVISRHDEILREQIEACGGTDTCTVTMDTCKAVIGWSGVPACGIGSPWKGF